MLFWRISRFRDLSGKGGLKSSARWHIAGTPVVYLAESPAGALLEICAHTAANDIPPNFTLLRIFGPDPSPEPFPISDLEKDWVAKQSSTQRLGSNWLQSRKSALLRVPSALVPETANYLLNPLHPDAAQFHIEQSYDFPFDLRLKS